MIAADEIIYQQDLNQTLRDGLSNNGWTVPQLTTAELTTQQVLNPANGIATTLARLMPVGTIWFVTDAVPPCYVGKIVNVPEPAPQTLVRFLTAAFP